MSLNEGMLWLAAILCLGSIALTCFAIWLKIHGQDDVDRTGHVDHTSCSN